MDCKGGEDQDDYQFWPPKLVKYEGARRWPAAAWREPPQTTWHSPSTACSPEAPLPSCSFLPPSASSSAWTIPTSIFGFCEDVPRELLASSFCYLRNCTCISILTLTKFIIFLFKDQIPHLDFKLKRKDAILCFLHPQNIVLLDSSLTGIESHPLT